MSTIRFADFESRSLINLKDRGASRYCEDPTTEITLLAWVDVVDGVRQPPVIWDVPYGRMPPAVNDDVMWVFAKADFDRTLWRHHGHKIGMLPPDYTEVLDAYLLFSANGLPRSLDWAGLKTGAGRKIKSKDHAKLMDAAHSLPPPGPLWDSFKAYCVQDVMLLADICLNHCPNRPIWSTWEEYAAASEVNDYGMPVDMELVHGIVRVFQPVERGLNEALYQLTGVPSLSHAKKLTEWFYDALPLRHKALMHVFRKTKTEPRGGTRLSLDAKLVLPKLRAVASELPVEAQQALDLIEGRSATVRKYTAITHRVTDDGFLRGEYEFDGAFTSGRFSAKGVQIHNLKKKSADPEFIADVLEADGLEALRKWGPTGVMKQAAFAVRQVFRAKEGHALLWSDWSQIEARILPWLTLDPTAASRIAVFAANGDIYMKTVQDIWGHQDRAFRQAAKVFELALGFCGGIGSINTFLGSFGLTMPDDDKQAALESWNAANPWAQSFAAALEEAFYEVYANGGTQTVGRVVLGRTPGGDVAIVLPSGRPLWYTGISPHGQGLTYRRYDANGTSEDVRIWRGLLSENVTQAVGADMLRGSILLGRRAGLPICGHTHDEIITHPTLDNVAAVRDTLTTIMTTQPSWATGLPLNIEWSLGDRYGWPTSTGIR